VIGIPRRTAGARELSHGVRDTVYAPPACRAPIASATLNPPATSGSLLSVINVIIKVAVISPAEN